MMKTIPSKILLMGAIGLVITLGGCGTTSSTVTSTSSSTTTSAIAQATSSNITLNDQSISITQAGTYTLNGAISNGQVIVDVGEGNEVRLQLAGVDITSKESSPLLIKSGKATIELVSGTSNTLTDGVYDENSDENATIYAEEDLVIEGEGKLKINANGNDGITSKDDLTIKSGNIEVQATDDGIRGKDSLTIDGGKINVVAGGDGLKSDHETKGAIVMNGGEVSISAGSDGAEAYKTITINGGTLNILKSYEGLESEVITINDGEISIVSSDDGINISDSSSTSSEGMMHRDGTASGRILTINGGKITIDARADGLDSNGAIEMNGGTAVVFGPTDNGNAALDYDETFTVNGGTLLAFGSNGMAMNVSNGNQNSVLIGLSNQQSASTKFSLVDSNGNTIFEATPTKAWSSVVVSTAGLKLNSEYRYLVDGVEAGSFTLTSSVMSAGTSGGMMGGHGGMGGGRPSGTPPQKPSW
ncbi:MAG: carbohydrate-binding domain-containing protein [Candidatus Absconditicoccaceae bacterium]